MPQFQKGQPKLGGRKKGTKNRLKRVADRLADLGIDPLNETIELLHNGDMKDAERARLWMEVQSYCEAKPKENFDDDGDPSESEGLRNVSDETLLKLVKNEAT